MVRYFKIAVLAFLFSTCVVHAVDELNVLWWMFDDDTLISDVNGSSATYTIDTLVGRGDAQGKTVNAIRVAAYNGDEFLSYVEIADGVGDGLDYYPVPTTVLEKDGTVSSSWSAGPTYSWIGDITSSTPGVSFMIELGNWNSTASAGSQWTILAHSDKQTAESLHEFYISASELDQQTKTEWTGGNYTVPEPSSGLLLLIGGALLALRRRPRG